MSSDSSDGSLSPAYSACSTSCLVCGDKTSSKNFGGISCRACAAFFRRTFTQRKEYRCCYGKSCFTHIRRNIHLKVACKYCRLQRCLEIGMQWPATGLYDRLSAGNKNVSSPLGSIGAFYEGLFTTRIKTTISLGYKPIKKGVSGGPDTLHQTFTVERCVLSDLLRSIDDAYHTNLSRIWANEGEFKQLFDVWLFFEQVIATARNNGSSRNEFYFVDDTMTPVNEEAVEDVWRRMVPMSDWSGIARLAMDMYCNILPAAAAVRRSRLSNTGLAACVLLAFTYYDTDLFSSRQAQLAFSDSIFSDLKAIEGEDSFVLVVDAVSNFLSEFHRAYNYHRQVATAIELGIHNTGYYATLTNIGNHVQCFTKDIDNDCFLGVKEVKIEPLFMEL